MRALGEFEAMGRTYPVFAVCIGRPGPGRANVLINAGIHGDEPAGVEAAVRFVERAAREEALHSRFSFVIFPCNNPTGYELDTRENWRGIDLNRQFNVRRPEPEARMISETLKGQCFDLVFEMHEDIDSHGLYLYEISEDENACVGELIIEAAASAGYPVNLGECIEGLPALGGVIRRSIDIKGFRKTRLPQAIYIYRTCGGHVITLEPPASVLPLEDRVRIELMALDIALENGMPHGRRDRAAAE